MVYETAYVAKVPDSEGYIAYTPDEDAIWQRLYARQLTHLPGRAADEFIAGLELLGMPRDRVPQCCELDAAMGPITGFGVAPVPALIPFKQFFSLLANRRFPAASFIRNLADFDYVKEPDIFHEFFGHCPMLTVPRFADFMQAYGELGCRVGHKQQVLLARLYWYTVEFGLIDTPQGLRIYGGGILSSPEETCYALNNSVNNSAVEYREFNVRDMLATPYRIDEKQPRYFVIKSYEQLFELLNSDLLVEVERAISMNAEHAAYC